jgi:hypothetical protein
VSTSRREVATFGETLPVSLVSRVQMPSIPLVPTDALASAKAANLRKVTGEAPGQSTGSNLRCDAKGADEPSGAHRKLRPTETAVLRLVKSYRTAKQAKAS